ncbi:19994_t:CDS:2, partial [Entrophospora sp. SA101]
MEKRIELGLTIAQRIPKIMAVINPDVDLTKQCQNWVVATVPSGVYKLYARNYSNVFKTSDPFSIYTISSTQIKNSIRNTIIGSVIIGITSIVAAAITTRYIVCKCRRERDQHDVVAP